MKEASGGQLVIELYPNSQLGDDTAMCEMIRNGNLDMMVTGGEVPGRWYSPVNLMAMPYLFKDLDHLERCIYGEPGEIMAKGLSQAGLGVFDYWLRANRQILSKEPIETLDDMQGLKIRVPETDIWIQVHGIAWRKFPPRWRSASPSQPYSRALWMRSKIPSVQCTPCDFMRSAPIWL